MGLRFLDDGQPGNYPERWQRIAAGADRVGGRFRLRLVEQGGAKIPDGVDQVKPAA